MIEVLNSTKLVIESKLDSLENIMLWLESTWEQYQLPDDRRFDVSVSLYEAVANVIMYAFEKPTDNEIIIELEVLDDMVQITVEDDGRPFNPLDHPEPILPSSISEAAIGGHGITLIKRLSDRLQYVRHMERNKLTMTNYLTAPAISETLVEY